VVVDVVGPFAGEDVEGAEDDAEGDEGEDGDADESPEVKEALVEEGAEAGGGAGEIAEENAGGEDEEDKDVDGDAGGVACEGSGAFVDAADDLGESTEVEAADEALGEERVVEDFAELRVEAEAKEQREAEADEIGPEDGREAPDGEEEAVEKDAAMSGHAVGALVDFACAAVRLLGVTLSFSALCR
jgi:hypothetical protein